jgi:hypothetical protein
VRQGEETRIIAIQGKMFYNGGTPIMLGVLSDVTPTLETNAGRKGKRGPFKAAQAG